MSEAGSGQGENIPNRIIDAHHHLWDLDECHYPWLMEKGVHRFFGDPTPIQKNYLADDFRADIGDLPIVKSVHIQVGVAPEDSIKESGWLQQVAEQRRYPHAIIAFCDLTAPDAGEQLDRQQSFANVRGVRQIVGRSVEEDAKTGTSSLLGDPAFAAGLKDLAERGLSFDLQLTPPLMQSAASLFKSGQDTPLALCHCGSPSDFSQEGMTQWHDGLKAFAEHENMICKISGFGMFDHDWTAQSISDHVLRIIDIFGPDRIAFGSNFPVDGLYASYGGVFGAYLKITERFSAAERAAMFHDTAARFYRI